VVRRRARSSPASCLRRNRRTLAKSTSGPLTIDAYIAAVALNADDWAAVEDFIECLSMRSPAGVA
jgi:RNA:NAD 2'-phosphotransferase (TPT1/KptA family)